MKTIMSVLLLFFLAGTAGGKNPGQELLHQGMDRVLRGSTVHDRAQLLEGHAIIERVHFANPDDPLALYYLAYSEYALTRYGMSDKESGVFDAYVDQALAHARQILAMRPEWSEGLALLANIHAIQISQNWVTAATLGPEASALAERAVRSDSANPRAWLVRGIMKLNTPGFFGGSADAALLSFTRAKELFERPVQQEQLNPGWGHAECYAWIGKTYEKLERFGDARAAYDGALAIEPDFVWVKRVLLPGLNKRLAGHPAQ